MAASTTQTGAVACVKALQSAGVDVCFANPGTTEMFIVAGLDATPGVRAVLGLHETVCSGAADGYGRMARKPAATLLHLGPGLANSLANLHNARRARSPVVNLVGDMASWHASSDAPLCMDIEALAGTVSGWVRTCKQGAEGLAVDAAEAVAAAMVPASSGSSRVATLIVPHDASWSKTVVASPYDDVAREALRAAQQARGSSLEGPEADGFFESCAAALKAAPRGTAAMLLGGGALLADDMALHTAAAIAAATGCALLCENGFARVDRGGALPPVLRLPYFPKEAAQALQHYTCLLLVDAKLPVPMFGYEAGPRTLVQLPEEEVWDLDALDAVATLVKLARALGVAVPTAPQPQPFPPKPRPALGDPKAPLTASLLCAAVAALQPPGAIVVDEALTTGTDYWMRSADAPQFSHLTLTGGAIGQGLPASVGAAVACPDRRVVLLQADGSGLYSVQALWTMAREALDVVVVVCANSKYNILKLELAIQRVGAPGAASRALTDLSGPAIDWVALATGFGVRAARVATVGALADEFTQALARKGPTLIEAVLP